MFVLNPVLPLTILLERFLGSNENLEMVQSQYTAGNTLVHPSTYLPTCTYLPMYVCIYLSIYLSISDGLSRTGTFCASFTVLERVKAEQVVDVFATVKSLRIQRPGLLKTLVSVFIIYHKNHHNV